ncbi:MAG: hypothetical protein H7230_01595, partial [Candidatus Parcubacteria bacterium]|nr:hypothetical protein [Candidatus Paceibacterota bacterium]
MFINLFNRGVNLSKQLVQITSSLILGICLVSTLVSITVLAAEFNLTTSVIYNSSPVSSPLTVNTSTPFTYYVNYTCQSTVGNCQGNKIVLDIPKIEPITETLPVGISKTYDSINNKYTLTFNNSTPLNTTGQISINMQIQAAGVTQGESLPIQVSTVSGTNPAETYPSQSFTLIAGNSSPVKELKFYFNKRVNALDPSAPGQSGNVEMRINNNPTDALPLINPVMYDLLPVGQILDETSYTTPSTTKTCVSWYCVDAGRPNLPAPIVTKTLNFNNTGKTLLKFDWSGTSALTLDGSATNPVVPYITDILVNFKVKFDSTLPKTTLVNEGFATSANTEPKGVNYCVGDKRNADIYDLNQNGSTSDIMCLQRFNNNIVPPQGSSELSAVLSVKGDLDTTFKQYPDLAKVSSGGDIDYQLAITNPAGAIKDLDIYDIFPSVGDRGVVSSEPRYSAWKPTLKAPISLPSGVMGTVLYTTVMNPCRDTLSPDGTTPFPADCNPAYWSATPPTLIDTTTGVRFNLTGYTNSSSFNINYRLTGIAGNDFNGTVAWSSFGYVSTSVATGLKFSPVESLKVGVKYFATDLFSLGNRVWVDTNKDGLINNAETGIDGVKVNLLNSTGAAVLNSSGQPTTTLTAGGGYYRFDNLAGGNYIAEIASSNFVSSGMLVGYASSPIDEALANNDIDGNDNGIGELNTSTGIRSSIVTLAKPEVLGETDLVSGLNPQGGTDDLGNMTLDFGFYALPTTINGKIFLDTNNSGIQEASEPNTSITNPIPTGTTVTITSTTIPANTYSAIINSDGTYTQNVPAGTYTVTVVSSGYSVTGNPLSNPTTVTVGAGETKDAGQDGLYMPSKIIGKIFLDSNNNGLQDASEPNTTLSNPIPTGTTVTVKSTTTPANTFSAVINTDGAYTQDVIAGTYTVTVVAPAGYTITGGSNPTSVTASPAAPVDAGFDGLYLPATITGKVFLDNNNSGIQESSEPNTTTTNPIPTGTTVTITDTTTPANTFGAVIKTDGTYTQNVPAGTYSVTVVAPSGYTVTGSPLSNPTNVTVVPGQIKDAGQDGLYIPSKITGKVFLDTNNNGLQDASEPDGTISTPIPEGTSVTITDTTTPANTYSAVINVDGTYSQNVPAGTYTVTVVSYGYSITGSPLSNPTTVTASPNAPVNAGADGLYLPTTITGKVYLDLNKSGTQDITEPNTTVGNPIPAGTTVTITSTTVPANTYTAVINTDGTYSQIVPAGTYIVTVAAPSAYTITGNSNPTMATAILGTSTNAGQDGLYTPPKIIGKIFLDNNNNGLQDASEPNATTINPIPMGTTVTITDTTSPAITFTSVINTDGTYSQDVPAGTYAVAVVAPAGYTVTGSPLSNPTSVTAVLGATTNAGQDGLYTPSKITGKIFLDNNNNGTQDANEPNTSVGNPIPAGTTVTITDTASQANTSTVAIGFDGGYTHYIAAGTYTVTVAVPAGYIITGNPLSNPTTVTASPTAPVDAGMDGLYRPATITGKIFLDTNNNGLQDGTEPNTTAANPIPAGTKVTITDTTTPANTFVAVINTDGSYTQDVPGGTYTVTVAAPSAYTVTGNPLSNPTTVTLVPWEIKDAGQDGLYTPPMITGKIFLDTNNNGTQDASEPNTTTTNPIPAGTTVTITDTTTPANTYTAVINTDGIYNKIVPAGTYTVTVTPPSGSIITGSPLSNPTTVTVNLGAITYAGQDGLYTPSKITGKIFLDTNKSGVQEASEPNTTLANPIPAGTTVTVTSTTVPANTFAVVITTDGTYTQNVPAGTYTVTVVAPSGYTITGSPLSNPTTVTASPTAPVDAGFDGLYLPATITGKVFLDLNNNGTQDATEPNTSTSSPLPSGTTVTITNTTTATTFAAVINTDGTYTQNVPAGTYTVTVASPSGYTVTGGSNPTSITVVPGQSKDAGPDGIHSNTFTPATLNLKLNLQGAFDVTAGAMKTSLRTKNLIPAAQPYNNTA